MPERVIVRHISERTHVPYRVLYPLVFVLRYARAVAYVSIAVGSALSLIPSLIPASIRASGFNTAQIITWSIVLMISASVAAYGVIVDVWWGEYVGLIPMSLLSVVYAIASFIARDGGVTRGFFLLGLGFLFLAIWDDRAKVRMLVADEAHRRREGSRAAAGTAP
jgi:hypothetical protein